MPVLIAINVWKLFPFVAIMVLAGLQSIPNDLYEAARVDGAAFWEEVLHIMLPSVRPVITAVTLLLVIWGLNSITIIYAITRGGPANKTPDHADPDLPLRLRALPVQPGGGAVGNVLCGDHCRRVRLHQGAARTAGERPNDGTPRWPFRCSPKMQEAGAWLARHRHRRIIGGGGLSVPVRLDGALLDQDAQGASTQFRRSGGHAVPTLNNYYKVLFESNIPRYFVNSVVISVGSTALALILARCSPVTASARFDFKGKMFWQAFAPPCWLGNYCRRPRSSCRCSSHCACSAWSTPIGG